MGSRKCRAGISRLLRIGVTVALFLTLHADRESFSARAQSESASLRISVIDERAAVIPGVNVTLLNLDTALQRHATTDDQGSCVVPLLPPGSYNVTAQRDGFAPVEVRRVVLNTGDQRALRVNLKVGEIGASVTIIDGA